MTVPAVRTRAQIRRYAVELLKANVDVDNRVYANRPSALFLEELPCICVYFESEVTDIVSGDRYRVKEYQRNAQLVACAVVEGNRTPGDESEEGQRGEDFLDYIGYQIEQAFFSDWLFARQLPDFDPNTNFHGLLLGSKLISVTPYEVDTESDRRMLAQDLHWLLPYRTRGYIDKKYASFEEYKAEIVRVGSTEATVDRVLISAEGDLEDV